MNEKISGKSGAPVEDFVITRVFDAPRDTVWKAWTEPEHIKHWWGPKGMDVVSCTLDLRVGGMCHYCLRGPDGEDMWGRYIYREIVPPERLVFIVSFSDPKGGITTHPMSPTWPRQMHSTVTFKAQGNKTEVTIRWQPLEATDIEIETFDEGRDSMRQGWGGSLDRLAVHLAGA